MFGQAPAYRTKSEVLKHQCLLLERSTELRHRQAPIRVALVEQGQVRNGSFQESGAPIKISDLLL